MLFISRRMVASTEESRLNDELHRKTILSIEIKKGVTREKNVIEKKIGKEVVIAIENENVTEIGTGRENATAIEIRTDIETGTATEIENENGNEIATGIVIGTAGIREKAGIAVVSKIVVESIHQGIQKEMVSEVMTKIRIGEGKMSNRKTQKRTGNVNIGGRTQTEIVGGSRRRMMVI